MPYVSVHVDADDVLEELSDDELREELRRHKKPAKDDPAAPHQWTPVGFADDLRTAFYARNASRFEMLLLALEPHERTVGLVSKLPLKPEIAAAAP